MEKSPSTVRPSSRRFNTRQVAGCRSDISWTSGNWNRRPVEYHDAVLRYENARRIFPDGGVYHRAFETTLFNAVRTACTSPRDLMVFVHDDGPDFTELLAIFRSYRRENRDTGKRLTTLLPLDDKETPALQVADMFSNALQRASVKQLTGQAVSRNEVFMLDRSKVGVWTKELGEDVLYGNLKKRGFPVPQDLEQIVLARHPEWKEYPNRAPILRRISN